MICFDRRDFMGLKLREFTIENYRGLNNIRLVNLHETNSISGPNNSNKTSILNALSLIRSDSMHKIKDLPIDYKSSEIDLSYIPVKIIYLFELTSDFNELIRDPRIIEVLSDIYSCIIDSYKDKDDLGIIYKEALVQLQSKPFYETMIESLRQAIKKEFIRFPEYESFKPLFISNTNYKQPENIFSEFKYLHLTLEISFYQGPYFTFKFLDRNKKTVVDDEVISHWMNLNDAIVDQMFFGYIVGSVFIKSILNSTDNQRDFQILYNSFLDNNGYNIKQYITYLLLNNNDLLRNVENHFKTIFHSIIRFRKSKPGVDNIENDLLCEIGRNNRWFSIDNISAGMMHVIRILLQYESCKKGDIVLIDEPELHLHPGAARALRNVLNKKKDIQIILATHSPIFIDPAFINKIFLLNSKGLKREIDIHSETDIQEVLTSLGSSGLDLLMYDTIIWVEGPSDKIYVNSWLESLIPKKVHQIGINYFGGGDLSHIQPSELVKINKNIYFILDSDKKGEKEKIPVSKTRFRTKCKKEGIPVHILKRREIENYIPTRELENVLKLNENSISIGPYDDTYEILSKHKRNFNNNKIKLANQIVKKTSKKSLKQDPDVYKEIQKIISAINNLMS